MLDHGATDYNGGLCQACLNGHIDIVKLMLDRGASEYDKGIRRACVRGHVNIIRLLIARGATSEYTTVHKKKYIKVMEHLAF